MNAPPNPRSTDSEPVLTASGLTKTFKVQRRAHTRRSGRAVLVAVDKVDVTLHRRRTTALVGESGSGKSTVVKLLARLLMASQGDIRLHGQPVPTRGGRRLRAYRGHVQVIFQDPYASLNPAHTVEYHLRRALRLHGQFAGKAVDLRTSAHALLEQVQLTPPDEYLGKHPHQLSGGERQRVAVARALAAGPEVLLADEPLSMLDMSIRAGLLNVLRGLRDRFGLSILFVTHDIASARHLADDTW